MRNQIAAAERAGITVVTVKPHHIEEWEAIYADITAGRVNVLVGLARTPQQPRIS